MPSIRNFSAGMQQRVKPAESIVHGPKLVLLSEEAEFGQMYPGRCFFRHCVAKTGFAPTAA